LGGKPWNEDESDAQKDAHVQRRWAMVAAVRAGASLRAVARRFAVSLRTVQVWVARARGQRLDRVEWRSRPRGRRIAVNRTPRPVESRILRLRHQLRTTDVLGEFGAAAIHRALAPRLCPSVRTIGRILARHGVLDRQRRVRRPPPPPGWYLPAVAQRTQELDLFDVIEDLKLADGPLIDVLTGVALHGGLPTAWPLPRATTSHILPCLTTHWRGVGLPGFAQFDNDTRFQGAHQHRDVFGRVVRYCLGLGVTPVFVPPREFGLQNPIEQFNGLYQAKVWHRFHFPTLRALQTHTTAYVQARRQRLAPRIGSAPTRRPWPLRWRPPTHLPRGEVIYIRRTNERGEVRLLGQTWRADPHWCHRLVRVEVDLRRAELRCFTLRRSAPESQPLVAVRPYRYPRGDLEA